MLTEDRELIESYLADGDSCRETGDWGSAKVSFLKALEELKRVAETASDPEATIGEHKELKSKILEKMAGIDVKLAFTHLELGRSALKSRDFSRAVEELEEAIELASETDIEFMESVKKDLSVAQEKERDQRIYKEITPFVKRGDEFRESGNFGEAILEYQEALRFLPGLPVTHRFHQYIEENLTICRRSLIRPYLSRIYWATHRGANKKAFEILQRVMMLIDEKDMIYRSFLELLRDEVKAKLKPEALEEDDLESPDDWERAVKDYDEALNLYSSFSAVDPLSPVYSGTNVYEDRFMNSRRKLADLYRKRGDRLRNDAKIEKAVKNYKEALKLYPRGCQDFHDTFRQLKRLRAQITAK
jgi:tetratricopeptide (TPR) repeat protein